MRVLCVMTQSNIHVHHGSQWLVQFNPSSLLHSLSLSLSHTLVERREVERAGQPPPSEGHTWVGSELRDYRVELKPNSFTVDSQPADQGPRLSLGRVGEATCGIQRSLFSC